MARSKTGGKPGAPKTRLHGVIQTPPMLFPFDPNTDKIREIAAKLPPGLFSVVANESARYTSFLGHCLSLVMPNASRYSIHTGCYVVDSCNRAYIGHLSEGGEKEDWVMLMGDDHAWPPWILLKLLGLMYENDLDIIVPVCFKRDFPNTPVLYKYKDADESVAGTYAYNEKEKKALFPIDLNDYPDGGLIEVDAAGSAGMVVRRRVIEAMEPPWFRIGQDSNWGEDLDFCRRAQDHGFRIWADLDMPLGHIVNTTLWPIRHTDGHWTVQYDFGNQGGFKLAL